MKKYSKMKKKNCNSGFSMIELVVILLVISVLVVAVAPKAVMWIKKAEENRLLTEKTAIITAAQISITEVLASDTENIIEDKTYTVEKDGGIKPEDTFSKSMSEILPSDVSFSRQYKLIIEDGNVQVE